MTFSLPTILALLVAAVFTLDVASSQTPAENAPWDVLRGQLRNAASLIPRSIPDWQEECVAPFEAENFGINTGYTLKNTLNWNLFNQPSGLCLDCLSCSYQNCEWPYDPVDSYRTDDTQEDKLDLPHMVLFPTHAGDVIAAVMFAHEYGVPVTVKSTGHSFYGASTGSGSLLINMFVYPKYSIKPSTNVTDPPSSVSLVKECTTGQEETTTGKEETALSEEEAMICSLATARSKTAYVRVGGGEVWDEPLRAVYLWNEDITNENKYHIVSGGASSVGAAGGWLASGGLSGTTGHRMYGIGIDQVLHMEMVLPDGKHIRFGPSKWEDETGYLYPTTTEITGFCNFSPNDAAVWEKCSLSNGLTFDDLWFAVLGGGGGTYGVVLSVYYQLHEYPGELTTITIGGDFVGFNQTVNWSLAYMWTDFHIDFFFHPKNVNVSETNSNMCGTAGHGIPQLYTILFCYGDGYKVWKDAWDNYIMNRRETWIELVDEDQVAQISADKCIYTTTDQYGEFFVEHNLIYTPGDPVIMLAERAVSRHTLYIPKTALLERREDMVMILTKVLLSGGMAYLMGGGVENAQKKTAIPEYLRKGGYMILIGFQAMRLQPNYTLDLLKNDKLAEEIYSALFAGKSGNDFPGVMSHSHSNIKSMGPIKNDWSKPCYSNMTNAERTEKCFSFQEGAFGTELLGRLETIHSKVDPKSIFECTGGVGYSNTAAPTVTPTAAPMPSAAPTVTPTAAPMPSGTRPVARKGDHIRIALTITGIIAYGVF